MVKQVGEAFYLLKPHNQHPNQKEEIEKTAFEAECKAVLASEAGSKKRKFESVCQRYIPKCSFENSFYFYFI